MAPNSGISAGASWDGGPSTADAALGHFDTALPVQPLHPGLLYPYHYRKAGLVAQELH